MNSYNFILIWIGVLAFFASIGNVYGITIEDGVRKYRIYLFVAVAAFFPVFYVASFGKPISDTVSYLKVFDNLPSDFCGLVSTLRSNNSGKAFTALGILTKLFFGEDQTTYRLIIGMIHSIPIVYVFRKYSEDYLFSVFLFVASALNISWMMNGLRQFIAVTLIFGVTPLLVKRKYIPVIIMVIIATMFHTSAIIMLPVVFIVQGKVWNKKTILYVFACIIAMYLFTKYTNLLDSMLVNTEYEGAIQTWQELGDTGTNPIRVLVNSIPAILAWFGRKAISPKDKVINICANMSIITMGLYLISMVTSGIMIGRLPIYTSLYGFILIPNLLPKMFNNQSARFVKTMMILFYLLYYYYQMHYVGGLI